VPKQRAPGGIFKQKQFGGRFAKPRVSPRLMVGNFPFKSLIHDTVLLSQSQVTFGSRLTIADWVHDLALGQTLTIVDGFQTRREQIRQASQQAGPPRR